MCFLLVLILFYSLLKYGFKFSIAVLNADSDVQFSSFYRIRTLESASITVFREEGF